MTSLRSIHLISDKRLVSTHPGSEMMNRDICASHSALTMALAFPGCRRRHWTKSSKSSLDAALVSCEHHWPRKAWVSGLLNSGCIAIWYMLMIVDAFIFSIYWCQKDFGVLASAEIQVTHRCSEAVSQGAQEQNLSSKCHLNMGWSLRKSRARVTVNQKINKNHSFFGAWMEHDKTTWSHFPAAPPSRLTCRKQRFLSAGKKTAMSSRFMSFGELFEG